MATPTIYKWTDPSAPVLTRNSMTSIKAVFQACLIDGYGSKTPPGSGANPWTIPFSDTTSFILKQGGTSDRKLCLKMYSLYSTNSYCYMQCARDYTALNTPVDIWAGGNSNERIGMGYSSNNSYNIPWVIIATERALYAFFGYNTSDSNTVPTMFDSTGSTNWANHHWFFGDYKPESPDLTVNQMISYSVYTSTTDSYYCQSFMYSDSDNGYGAKRLAGSFNNAHGQFKCETMWLRSNAGSQTYCGSFTSNRQVPMYPSPLNGGLYLDVYRIVSDRCLMGEFPGLLYPVMCRPFDIRGVMYEIPGTGAYDGETLHVFNDSNGSQFFIRDGEWGVE